MGRDLKKLYYDPASKGSFGGVDRLHRAASKSYTKREIIDWLKKQDVYTLHKPLRVKYSRRQTLVSSIDDVWQMDLVDMQKYKKQNDSFAYLLTCIDVFSKYAWAIPVKNKSSDNMIEAIKQILSEGRNPTKIQSDLGREFTNNKVQKFLKEKKIGFYTTFGDAKAAVVERFNRTLKSRMWRLFTHKGSHRYVEALPKLLSSYNTSYHRSIKMSPSQVRSTNVMQVRKNLFPSTSITLQPKLSIGDRVRISKLRGVFDKGYLPNWSDEVFTVNDVKRTSPVTYNIRDDSGEVLKGGFYEQELQKIEKTDQDLWLIEEILDERIRNGKRQVLVKWRGYTEQFNSWIDVDQLVSLDGN